MANLITRFPVEDVHAAGTGPTFRRGEAIMERLSFGHGPHYRIGA
ncbi:hypothetical protein AB0G54_18995 [Streptomyces yokosukanensis]